MTVRGLVFNSILFVTRLEICGGLSCGYPFLVGLTDAGPSPLALLDARCDPNILGSAQQSPILYALGLENNDAVEDLLIARADANHAPTGLEPPLCVAIRHRMGDIAKTLLT